MKYINKKCDNKSYQKIISIPLVPMVITFISIVCLILICFCKNVMSSNDSNDVFLSEKILLDTNEEDSFDNILTVLLPNKEEVNSLDDSSVLLPNDEKQIDNIPTEEVQKKTRFKNV